jgi:hypothetical protein
MPRVGFEPRYQYANGRQDLAAFSCLSGNDIPKPEMELTVAKEGRNKTYSTVYIINIEKLF